MTTEVTLQVEPIDFDDPVIDATVAALDGYMFARIGGVATVTVFSENSPAMDAIAAIRDLRQHGIHVVRVKEDPVNAPEIALRSHVSRQAVAKWIERDDFPAAFASLGGQRLWHWAHVLEWLKDVKGMPFDEELPDDKAVAEINSFIHNCPDTSSLWIHSEMANQPERRFACGDKVSLYDGVTVTASVNNFGVFMVGGLQSRNILYVQHDAEDVHEIKESLWSSKLPLGKRISNVR